MQFGPNSKTLEIIHEKIKEQDLGSWKLVRLTQAGSEVFNYLVKALAFSAQRTDVFCSNQLEFPLFAYPKAFRTDTEVLDFHLDFDPNTLVSIEQTNKLLQFFLALTKEFRIKALIFDEADHKNILIEFDAGRLTKPY